MDFRVKALIYSFTKYNDLRLNLAKLPLNDPVLKQTLKLMFCYMPQTTKLFHLIYAFSGLFVLKLWYMRNLVVIVKSVCLRSCFMPRITITTMFTGCFSL